MRLLNCKKELLLSVLMLLFCSPFAYGKAVQPSVSVCDRTEQVREEILRQVGKTDCSQVTDADLKTIVMLVFYFERNTTLQKGDFSGLDSVLRLVIYGNGLRDLPEGLFSGMDSLKELKILLDIMDLPERRTYLEESLEEPELSKNRSRYLPEGLLSGLAFLEKLDISWNKLEDLPEGLLSALVSLEELDLSRNNLKDLPDGLFSSSASLKKLDLSFNKLEGLQDGLLSSLVSLEYLNLSWNPLVDSGFSNIFSRLFFVGDSLTDDLPKSAISGLASLKWLEVNNHYATNDKPLSFSEFFIETSCVLGCAKIRHEARWGKHRH